MTALFYVIPCLLVSVMAGYFWGASTRTSAEQTAAAQLREKTLHVLAGLARATEQLHENVDSYDAEIREVEDSLQDIHSDGELAEAQRALLNQVTNVLQSNCRLRDDLSCTRIQVEEQAQQIDEVRREARIDSLSGTGNRKAFDERLEMFLARYRRHGQQFVLVLADIDHFKWINDSHGHQAGDLVVQQIGEILRECVRDGDYVARYGGDEFALLLSAPDLEMGNKIVQRLREAVLTKNFDLGPGKEQIAVSFSIGIAIAWDGATPSAILKRVDTALYQAKSAGRNCARCYEPELVGV